MVDLVPAPDTLHLASPALGPWFRSDATIPDTPPTLPSPAGDLSVALTLAPDMEWRVPAVCTRSYFVAKATRPGGLKKLRTENGSKAFTDDNLIVLLTLMPEAELRLWALTQQIPQPDGSALTEANVPSRQRIRYFALEVTANTPTNMSGVEDLRESAFLPDISSLSEADQAAYLGLTSSGSLGNAATAVTELCRPATDSAVALKNRKTVSLSVNLWCFDYRGRAVDPGAVANWWSYMASAGIWDNLWAHTDVSEQRTADVAEAKVVQISSAHEGPLDAALLARLNLTELNSVTGASALYLADGAPAIELTAAPDPDNAPLPRIAVMPNGNYQLLGDATPFAGWTGGDWPVALTRDFLCLSFVDIEQHVVGLSRSDSRQANEKSRVAPARNTAESAFLSVSDEVSLQVMNALSSGANSIAMAPVMDEYWGAVTPPVLIDNDVPDSLEYSIIALAGEGVTSTGGSVSEQSIAVHFEAGALPQNSWIRLWTFGLDTDTGLHFRQHGGAGFSDASGEAYVVLALPDGVGGTAESPVYLDFDALVTTADNSRYYTEQRFQRPATLAGSSVTLATGTAVPAGTSLWLCEMGAVFNRGAAEYQSGQALISIPDDPAGQYALVDLSSLEAADIAAQTLINAATAGDTLITTSPAFSSTPEGELTGTAGPGGSTVLHRSRNLLTELPTMGRPAPSMERREVLALDAGTLGVVGSTPGRVKNHEAPPSQLGHVGMPASAEIHGCGVLLSGPALDQLLPLMEERRADDLAGFLSNVGTPVTPTADPGGTNTWTVVLETLTHGVVGDTIIRALLAVNPAFAPGQTWSSIKSAIDSLPGVDLDSLIDTASFDDDALATAVDRMIAKTKDGAVQFATAVQAAINRAEDFIYIETPAIDAQAANSDVINIINAIIARWSDRPGLDVLLVVPEKYLPDQTEKIEAIRQSGINAALKELIDVAADRVVLFTPTAGSGRALHMASTTVVIDDAILLTGSTHLWRRGLTFDSSVSVGLFDENTTFGRPTAVRAARLQLMANALGVDVGLVPEDAGDCLTAVKQLNANGGLMRVKPNVYSAKENTVSAADLSVWNPDGSVAGASDWFTFLAALTGDSGTELNNAIR